MHKLISSSKIIICLGSGGVGKTSLAAALGFYAAASLGKRTLILTIDPSQRLKTTLGLSGDKEFVQIHDDLLKSPLFGSLVDHQKIFDDFVLKAASNSENVKKLLNNNLYKQLSTTLSGSQEFTALEKLSACYESGDYDLIVLDTPPTQHAIDFLNAPEKLAAIFNEKISKWFRFPEQIKKNPFLRWAHSGTTQMLKILEMLTGSEFVHELSDFFLQIEKWEKKIEDRVLFFHQLLSKESTRFVLISSLDDAKLKESLYFSKELKKNGYKLSGLILNRAYPLFLRKSPGSQAPPLDSDFSFLYQQIASYYESKDKLLLDFKTKMNDEYLTIKLPELEMNISDLDGVKTLSQLLKTENGTEFNNEKK